MLDLDEIAPLPPPSTTRVGRRLLDAAGELFYERGITAVGVDLLAEHACTTKRTLYQRFGSKDGLVTAYLEERAHRWQTALLADLETLAPASPTEAIDAVFGAAQRWAGDSPHGCAFVNAWAELRYGRAPGLAVITAEKQWMLRVFERIAGEPELAARVHLVYEGAQVLASTLGDHDAFVRGAATARRLLES